MGRTVPARAGAVRCGRLRQPVRRSVRPPARRSVRPSVLSVRPSLRPACQSCAPGCPVRSSPARPSKRPVRSGPVPCVLASDCACGLSVAVSARLRKGHAAAPEPHTLSMRCPSPVWPIRWQSSVLKQHRPPSERPRHNLRCFNFPALDLPCRNGCDPQLVVHTCGAELAQVLPGDAICFACCSWPFQVRMAQAVTHIHAAPETC